MNKRTNQLNYEIHGKGTPVILLHGLFLDHQLWKPLVNMLVGKARVIIPDLRGHGRSFATKGTYRMADMAGDILRLMDDLNIKQAVLAGHSMGGYVCLLFSHLYPERLYGLALIASHAAPDTEERKQGRYDSARSLPETGLKPMASDMATRLSDDPQIQAALLETMLKTKIDGAIGTLYAIAERENGLPWLEQTQVPILLVYGSKDKFVPRARMEDILAVRPDARLIEIPGAGHVPMLEAPQLVAEALLRLIDEVSLNPSG